MKGAGAIPDRNDLLLVAAEQVGVFMNPGDRRRHVLCARRPGRRRREPVRHVEGDQVVARGKAHGLLYQRLDRRGVAAACKTVAGHEHQHRALAARLGLPARDVEDVHGVAAVFQAACERDAGAGGGIAGGGRVGRTGGCRSRRGHRRGRRARGSSSNPTLIRLSSRRCGALGGPEAAVNVMRSENARHFIILWTAFALPS